MIRTILDLAIVMRCAFELLREPAARHLANSQFKTAESLLKILRDSSADESKSWFFEVVALSPAPIYAIAMGASFPKDEAGDKDKNEKLSQITSDAKMFPIYLMTILRVQIAHDLGRWWNPFAYAKGWFGFALLEIILALHVSENTLQRISKRMAAKHCREIPNFTHASFAYKG